MNKTIKNNNPENFFLSSLKKIGKRCVFTSPWGFGFLSGCCSVHLSSLPDKYGIPIETDPTKADVLIITGVINNKVAPLLRRIYEQMPDPKKVITIGDCATNGGIFKNSYTVSGGADLFIPVDVKITGCPPTLEALIKGFKALRGEK